MKCRELSLIVRDPSNVRVGDVVWLQLSDSAYFSGRVVDLTGQPVCPFAFDAGFMPFIGNGGPWSFVRAVREVDASAHPAGGR
ncbi:hypothetical protein [Bifidobacterium biavatii]|uniref:Uncharacterized protein n=1 Tax=Bifidobacterium biavatii DSM 23969 TaxID=1437608 RepID=A0A086ZUH7_9BIFI|nr:hypothetical protein [Bifidobacterium biavatii]KFI50177.1 hypothetical protein BBIA_1659 [Bifidobacterium biavatii DSM 23969]